MKLPLLAYAAGQRQSTPVCMYVCMCVCVCGGAKDTPEVGKAPLIIFRLNLIRIIYFPVKDVYIRVMLVDIVKSGGWLL